MEAPKYKALHYSTKTKEKKKKKPKIEKTEELFLIIGKNSEGNQYSQANNVVKRVSKSRKLELRKEKSPKIYVSTFSEGLRLPEIKPELHLNQEKMKNCTKLTNDHLSESDPLNFVWGTGVFSQRKNNLGVAPAAEVESFQEKSKNA
ncbi:hypothetical protein HK096_001499, partial [Nowakowskiella sp. JEL0078]